MSRAASLSRLLALVVCFGLPAMSSADLVTYTEDFESMNVSNPNALTNAGWLIFGNVYNAGGTFVYDYGPFGAPNGQPSGGFSDLATGEGGAAQGAIQLNTYNDYNNADHTNNPTWTIESNIFREQFIGTPDLGTTWRFSFDAKASATNGPAPPSTTAAFIKVLDSVGGTFNLLAFKTFPTTNLPSTWGGGFVDIDIDPSWNGQLLQIGFINTASNFSPTGVFYDNLGFQFIPEPGASVVLAMGLLGMAGIRRRRK